MSQLWPFNGHITAAGLHLARRLQSAINEIAWLVDASSKCDHITPLLRQLHWLKVSWRIDYKLAVLVYKYLGMASSTIRRTSLTNFIIQQRRSFEGVCVPLRLTNCLFPVPESQLTATELFQSPLYGSGTVFHSISHLRHHLLSSALAWGHISSNSFTRNYCCRVREVTLSFLTRLDLLTYLQQYGDWYTDRYTWYSDEGTGPINDQCTDFILLSRRSRQRERLSASVLSICLIVCLFVCRQNAKKTLFSEKLSNLELLCLLTTYRKSYLGFSKNPLLDP